MSRNRLEENLARRISFYIKPMTGDCYRCQVIILILLRSYIYHIYAYSLLERHPNNFITNTCNVNSESFVLDLARTKTVEIKSNFKIYKNDYQKLA